MNSKRSATRETLREAERDAWFEYLSILLGEQEPRYSEIEPWAWRRLQRRLSSLRRRRSTIAA